ncbi:hypothetical protein KIN20_006878 [Parelaphostrongylus tenuis]|uniref:Uncharacterized protein n=1 Tax=Parelaphostrongylus tenuis TaxID=148309 RepID=A0AAD5M5K0_PARTN|nr:hypothetical protein KIN20_006878 [Parelaphostrongylus tenuis]
MDAKCTWITLGKLASVMKQGQDTISKTTHQPKLKFRARKITPPVFWDEQGMAFCEAFGNKQTTDAGIYGKELRKLAAAVQESQKRLIVALYKITLAFTLQNQLARLWRN